MAKKPTSLEKSINLRHNMVLILVIFVCILSSLTILSVSKGEFAGLFQKHIMNIFFAIFIYLLFIRIKIPRRYFLIYYLITIILLLIPFFTSSYPKRWIKMPMFSFQPSEIAKVPFLISLSIFLQDKENMKFRDTIYLFFLCFLPFLLVLIEPDMGSSIFYIFMFFVIILFKKTDMNVKLFYIIPPLSLIFSFNYITFIFFLIILTIFVIYVKIRRLFAFYFILISIFIGLATPFVWNKVLKDYQRERIKVFLNPSLDPKGAGWQINQGLIAIGSGRVTGKGFMKGMQKGLAFLPAAHTDFIFASFAEEFGFIGGSILFAIYFLFFWNLIFILKYTDSFTLMFSVMVIFSYLYSFSLNLGGEMGIIPLTGIPLPFFSYGGTSLVTNFLLLSLFRNFQRSFFYKR